MNTITNITNWIAELKQRQIELEETLHVAMDNKQANVIGDAIDINSSVIDSASPAATRVAPWSDVFGAYTEGTKYFLSVDAALGIFKIVGGSAGNWSIQRVGADDVAYGPTLTGVTVVSGHGEPFTSGDWVLAMAIPTLGANPGGAKTWKIWNGIIVDMS